MKKYIGIIVVILFGKLCQITAQENKLSIQQEKTITIVAFTAKGEWSKLKKELDTGLDAGLDVNEIQKIITYTSAYNGYPRAIGALQILKTVLDERNIGGVNDKRAWVDSDVNPHVQESLLLDSQRELIIISVLISLGGLDPLLRSHIQTAINQGITLEQIKHILNVFDLQIKEGDASSGWIILEELGLKTS